jgi:hypothetical protein
MIQTVMNYFTALLVEPCSTLPYRSFLRQYTNKHLKWSSFCYQQTAISSNTKCTRPHEYEALLFPTKYTYGKLEDLGVDQRILKWILQKQGARVWTGVTRLRIHSSGRPCEHSNELLSSTKCLEFVDLSLSNSKNCSYSNSISTYTEVLVLSTCLSVGFTKQQ